MEEPLSSVISENAFFYHFLSFWGALLEPSPTPEVLPRARSWETSTRLTSRALRSVSSRNLQPSADRWLVGLSRIRSAFQSENHSVWTKESSDSSNMDMEFQWFQWLKGNATVETMLFTISMGCSVTFPLQFIEDSTELPFSIQENNPETHWPRGQTRLID